MAHKYEYDDEYYYYSGEECDSSENDTSLFFSSLEDVQDWNSEELLNLWMSIVEYHENWYLPLRRTFNQFCEFVLLSEPLDDDDTDSVDIIQAIKNHPYIKGRDWNYFFSLSYK